MLKQHLMRLGVAALLAATTTAAASAQMDAGRDGVPLPVPVATAQIAGTHLTIQPTFRFERASLRVSGPRGYTLQEAFEPGEAIAVDLLDGAGASGTDLVGQPEPKATPQWSLADGIYRYEAIFFDASGERRLLAEAFFVEAGAATSRGAKRAQLGDYRRDLERARVSTPSAAPSGVAGGIPEPRLLESNYIAIDDTSIDDETSLVLDNDGPGVPTGWYWGVANDYDMLELGRTSSVSSVGRPYIAVEYGGQVGIGTTTPSARLHVESPTDTNVLKLTSFGTNTMRIAVGANAFAFYDTHGDLPIFVDQDAGSWLLSLDASGVSIGGDLSVESSREVKTAFESLDSADILERLRALPLRSWRYTSDPAQARHIGPVAEDFHAAFGLGIDDKHISPGDGVGVALVAIQNLAERVEALAAENRRLQVELTRQRKPEGRPQSLGGGFHW